MFFVQGTVTKRHVRGDVDRFVGLEFWRMVEFSYLVGGRGDILNPIS